MCGRYSQDAEFNELKVELQIEQLEMFRDFRPTYNIAPSYGPGSEQLFVVRSREGQRTLRLGRWWMIPHYWAKPLKALPAAFNARAEDLTQKPFWREPFKQYRCLVPATGWREFKGEKGKKQPYHFQLERHLFAFAGLWSRWSSPEGGNVDSFAIVTSAPNAAAAGVHDRMPLVMPSDLYAQWLGPEHDGSTVLQEARARSLSLELEIFPTDPVGNNVRFEGPKVIERIEVAKPSPAARAEPAQQSLFGDELTQLERRGRAKNA